MYLPDTELGIRVAVRVAVTPERQRRKLPLIGMDQFLRTCTGGRAQRQAHRRVQEESFRGRHMDRCGQACLSALKNVITGLERWLSG